MANLIIGPREIPLPISPGATTGNPQGDGSFSTMLKQTLGQVNQLQLQAGQSIQRLSTGEVQDVHQVMMAAEEANLAFDLMMEIRNKLMEAYQEVMRTQV